MLNKIYLNSIKIFTFNIKHLIFKKINFCSIKYICIQWKNIYILQKILDIEENIFVFNKIYLYLFQSICIQWKNFISGIWRWNLYELPVGLPVVLIAQQRTPFPGLCRLTQWNQNFLAVM